MIWTYLIIAVVLLVAELAYFRIADHYNIIDKPNERSSHSTIVLRGGGVIFAISMVIWFVWQMMQGEWGIVQDYMPFLIGLVLIAGVSFWDDIKSLPDSVRLVAQFTAILLMFWSIGIMQWNMWWIIPIALFVCIGATNFINFMDGINGITAGYSLAMLVPMLLVNSSLGKLEMTEGGLEMTEGGLKMTKGAEMMGDAEITGGEFLMTDGAFVDESYLIVAIIGVLVFSIFNFRPKGKAKCFAGDVGSIGIAFIILFALGRLMLVTQDVSYFVFFLVYGVDGTLTIAHRIMLHENLGQAHRKHAYQLMANELKMSHVTVSLIYMGLQMAVSLGFIYLCPNTVVAHWIYFVSAAAVLAVAYVLFKMKYYHLHEEYLASLKK